MRYKHILSGKQGLFFEIWEIRFSEEYSEFEMEFHLTHIFVSRLENYILMSSVVSLIFESIVMTIFIFHII